MPTKNFKQFTEKTTNNLKISDYLVGYDPITDDEIKTKIGSLPDLISTAKNTIDDILTGNKQTEEVININAKVLNSYSYRPEKSIDFPTDGWITRIYNVTLDNVILRENVDYVFYPDRQMIYFVGPLQNNTDVKVEGYTFSNLNGKIDISLAFKSQYDWMSYFNSSFRLSTVETTSYGGTLHYGLAEIKPFMDYNNNTLFFKQSYAADALFFVGVDDNTNLIEFSCGPLGTITSNPDTPPPIYNYSTKEGIDIPSLIYNNKSLFKVYIQDEMILNSSWDLIGNQIRFNTPIDSSTLIQIEYGPYIHNSDGSTYNINQKIFYDNFKGSILNLPQSITTINSVTLSASGPERIGIGSNDYYRANYASDTTFPYFYFNNNRILFGEVIQNSDELDGIAPLEFSGKEAYLNNSYLILKLPKYFGNIIYPPYNFTDITNFEINGEKVPVLYDYSLSPNVWYPKKRTGVLKFNAMFKKYQGLSKGGETFKIVQEIPGLMATTAGTGESINTISTTPSKIVEQYGGTTRNFTDVWKLFNVEGVQICDYDAIVIYNDLEYGSTSRFFTGFVESRILPVTPKLPLASLWPSYGRDDSALFREAFSINPNTPFTSCHYNELEDRVRIAESSVLTGKIVTLSTDKNKPVRGVSGISTEGTSPVYFAGSTKNKFVISTYKWFVVICTNTNNNSNLRVNNTYLLCVNNTNMNELQFYPEQEVSCKLLNDDYTVAVDVFKFEY
jgi:hypothetical protein